MSNVDCLRPASERQEERLSKNWTICKLFSLLELGY